VGNPIDIQVTGKKKEEFLPEERVLVCRLIPLFFSLDTDNPTWSSYLLTQTIKSATAIPGIKLSEIGIAFLEILCEFHTPLNEVVYNFCVDFSREFTVHYRKRLDEFKPLNYWENPCEQNSASLAFLKYALVPIHDYTPKFIYETMMALTENDYFEGFINEVKYLFENKKYKQEFKGYVLSGKLPKQSKDFILSVINNE